MDNSSKRHAFTMIEVLFVIVIIGIVGGLAIETIRQYYDGIYRTQIYSKRVAEADHILEQLSKYFENAVEPSIANMDQDAADGALAGACNGDPVHEAEGVAHDYTVAFVGVDIDTLRTVGTPGWSEKVKSTFNGTALTSDDADYTKVNAIIQALYPTSGIVGSAIYNSQDLSDTCNDFYTINGNAYYNITGIAGNTLTVTNNAGSVITGTKEEERDKKYLLRTGYAFRVLNDGNFTMFSNFRPWLGEAYTTGRRSVLGEHVASFYADFNNTNSFDERGSIWRLKICMQGLGTDLADNDTAVSAICRERKVHVRF